jgi:hypothetical protein
MNLESSPFCQCLGPRGKSDFTIGWRRHHFCSINACRPGGRIMAVNYCAHLDAKTRSFYQKVLGTLARAGIRFLVGGAYSLLHTAGIERHTKDLDIFIRRSDLSIMLEVLERAGFRTEIVFPHWLAKAHGSDSFIDIIFSSGNGVARVDDAWFSHAIPAIVLDVSVRLCPIEETIWSKAYIMERERYDGADVAHLLRAHAGELDWPRLLDRFGSDWRVLLTHLVIFGFIYPGERQHLPNWVLNELVRRLQEEDIESSADRVCQGTLLSRQQYLVDLEDWGYTDARLRPGGAMTREEVSKWTAGIDWEKHC